MKGTDETRTTLNSSDKGPREKKCEVPGKREKENVGGRGTNKREWEVALQRCGGKISDVRLVDYSGPRFHKNSCINKSSSVTLM